MDWIPAITSSSVTLVLAWLCQILISTRLENSVKHDYEIRMENLKLELTKNEELFKADLSRKQTEIDALRSGALSGIVKRQEIQFEKAVSAAELVWAAIVSLAPGKNVCSTMAIIKFDAFAKEAARDESFRKLASAMVGHAKPEILMRIDATKARPFVSDLLWAYFSAYHSIISQAIIKAGSLQTGLDKDYSDVEKITKVVIAALPHQEEYIKKFGPSAFFYLLDELEIRIIQEIRNLLKGESADKESIERAAKILKETHLLQENETKKKIEMQS